MHWVLLMIIQPIFIVLELSPLFTAMRELSGLSGTLSTFDDYSTDMSVFKTRRIMVYQCPTVHLSVRFTCRTQT